MKATNKKPVQKPLPQIKQARKLPSEGNKQYLFWVMLVMLFVISILAFSPMSKTIS